MEQKEPIKSDPIMLTLEEKAKAKEQARLWAHQIPVEPKPIRQARTLPSCIYRVQYATRESYRVQFKRANKLTCVGSYSTLDEAVLAASEWRGINAK